MAFYEPEELSTLGFRSVGHDVKISKAAVFYHPQRIEIGNHVRIDDFVLISACAEGFVKIGSHVHIAAYVMIEAPCGVILDDYSGLAARTSVVGASDNYNGEFLTGPTVPSSYRGESGTTIRVGRHVVVGAGSVLLPGTILGDGSALGAMSLARGELPGGKIYVGIPARPVATRSAKIYELEKQLETATKK